MDRKEIIQYLSLFYRLNKVRIFETTAAFVLIQAAVLVGAYGFNTPPDEMVIVLPAILLYVIGPKTNPLSGSWDFNLMVPKKLFAFTVLQSMGYLLTSLWAALFIVLNFILFIPNKPAISLSILYFGTLIPIFSFVWATHKLPCPDEEDMRVKDPLWLRFLKWIGMTTVSLLTAMTFVMLIGALATYEHLGDLVYDSFIFFITYGGLHLIGLYTLWDFYSGRREQWASVLDEHVKNKKALRTYKELIISSFKMSGLLFVISSVLFIARLTIFSGKEITIAKVKKYVSKEPGQIFAHIRRGEIGKLRDLQKQGELPSDLLSEHRKLSPLFFAIRKDQDKIVQFLLEAGHPVNQKFYSSDCLKKKVNDCVVNALSVSILDKSGQSFYYLVQKKNLLNMPSKPSSYTPLHYASSRCRTDMVHALLEKGADPNLQDKNGNSPLHAAAKKGCSKIINLLLVYNADPNLKNQDGKLPYHVRDENLYLSAEFLLKAKVPKDQWVSKEIKEEDKIKL